jgi:hypothetical protein
MAAAAVLSPKGASDVMLWKPLKCGAALACVVLALAGPSASADDKKDDKDKPALAGVWVLKDGEMRIEFSDKDVMKISPHGKDELILILCKYAVEKDGRVKVKVADLEGEAKDKVKELVPVGLEFSFTWKVKDDTAALDDVKGDKTEAIKSHLEGKYAPKK